MTTQRLLSPKRLLLVACGLVIMGIAASWSLLACEQPKEPFDRKAMLLRLADDVVIPSYEALSKAATGLDDASKALCKGPDKAKLQATRAAWLEAKLAWKRAKIFRFGPAESLEAQAHIDYWPSKTDLIDQELASDKAIDAAYVDNLGASRRGLPAIEYLLFPKDKSDEDAVAMLVDEKNAANRRCQMVIGLSDAIKRRSQMLLDAWKKSQGDDRAKLFLSVVNKDKSTTTWQPAIDEMVNEIVFAVQVIIDRQLGGPLGHKDGGGPQPDAAEAYRSQQSLALIKASLEGVTRIYMGAMTSDLTQEPDPKVTGKGLHGLLLHQSPRVDTHVRRDLYSAAVALGKLSQASINKAITDDKATVDNAWEVLKLLQITFKAEVVGDLGVVLTFSDLDGD